MTASAPNHAGVPLFELFERDAVFGTTTAAFRSRRACLSPSRQHAGDWRMGKAGGLWPVRARPEKDDRGEPKKSRSKDATDGVLWVEVVCQVPRRPRLRSSVAVLGRWWWSSERSGGARVLDRQDTGKVALLLRGILHLADPPVVGEAGGCLPISCGFPVRSEWAIPFAAQPRHSARQGRERARPVADAGQDAGQRGRGHGAAGGRTLGHLLSSGEGGRLGQVGLGRYLGYLSRVPHSVLCPSSQGPLRKPGLTLVEAGRLAAAHPRGKIEIQSSPSPSSSPSLFLSLRSEGPS